MHHGRSFTSFLLIVAFMLRFTSVIASSEYTYTPSTSGNVKQQHEHSSCVWLETNEELEEDDSEQDDTWSHVEAQSLIHIRPSFSLKSIGSAAGCGLSLHRETYLICRSLRL
ncbi:MAG: hypothetical protein ACKO6L_09420 [Flavobacteriales bacterium]